IALLTTDWMEGVAVSLDFTLRAATSTAARAPRRSFHGTARTPSYSASKSGAGYSASWISTRSAVRSPRLLRAIFRADPSKKTRLSAARAPRMPRFSSSTRTTDSRPKVAAATQVYGTSLTATVYSAVCAPASPSRESQRPEIAWTKSECQSSIFISRTGVRERSPNMRRIVPWAALLAALLLAVSCAGTPPARPPETAQPATAQPEKPAVAAPDAELAQAQSLQQKAEKYG